MNGGSKTTINYVSDNQKLIKKYPIKFIGNEYGVIVEEEPCNFYEGYHVWRVLIYEGPFLESTHAVYAYDTPYCDDVNICEIVKEAFHKYYDTIVARERRQEIIIDFLNMQEIDSSDWRTES